VDTAWELSLVDPTIKRVCHGSSEQEVIEVFCEYLKAMGSKAIQAVPVKQPTTE
jgi:hypothetical protein